MIDSAYIVKSTPLRPLLDLFDTLHICDKHMSKMCMKTFDAGFNDRATGFELEENFKTLHKILIYRCLKVYSFLTF